MRRQQGRHFPADHNRVGLLLAALPSDALELSQRAIIHQARLTAGEGRESQSMFLTRVVRVRPHNSESDGRRIPRCGYRHLQSPSLKYRTGAAAEWTQRNHECSPRIPGEYGVRTRLSQWLAVKQVPSAIEPGAAN